MAFEHTITVRFYEVDRAGIVFFGRVFEYCHETYEEMMQSIGLGLSKMFDDMDWGMPLVHAHADYKRPMRMGERLTVSMCIEKIGQSSITFKYTIRGEDSEIRCIVTLVHVCIQRSDFSSCPIPDELRDAFCAAGLLS